MTSLDAKQKQVEMAWLQREHAGVLRARLREVLSEQQNHRCCHCGVRAVDEAGPFRATIEHIVPRRWGGRTTYSNLAMACEDCNTRRGDDMTWRFEGR